MKSKLEWNLAKVFVRGKAAVRLTFAIVGRGSKLIFSHTPGMVRDGEFVPTMHLRDDYAEEYIALLRESATRASLISQRVEKRTRGALTVTMTEAIVAKMEG